MEDGMEIPLKTRNKTAIWHSNPTPKHIPWETNIKKDTCITLFIAALFIIARTWKQSRCPSTDEWIKKLWYIYRMEYSVWFSSGAVWFFVTPWTAALLASLSNTNSRSLLKLTSMVPIMPSNCLTLCHPLFLPPSIFPSVMVCSKESVLRIRLPKYWSFSFSISPSKEYSGLISFRMDWLDLLAVQGTLKSLLQHHSSKAWILRCSAFFIAQLSQPYMATGKTIALTRWTFVGKVISAFQYAV